MSDSKITTSARISKSTMKEYRKWAASTNRSVGYLLDIALRYALANKIDVEHYESNQNAAAVSQEVQ
jgi:hypothetical protein